VYTLNFDWCFKISENTKHINPKTKKVLEINQKIEKNPSKKFIIETNQKEKLRKTLKIN